MARKGFQPRAAAPYDQQQYSAFIADLLEGRVRATALIEQRDGRGALALNYDEILGAQQEGKV